MKKWLVVFFSALWLFALPASDFLGEFSDRRSYIPDHLSLYTGNDLFNYGLKDRTYAVDENGYRYTPDTYVADNDSISTNWWWGRNDALEIPSAAMNWDKINALYDEYNQIAVMYPYEAFVFDNSNVQSYINQCNEIYNTYMKYICFGQYDVTPEEIVAQFQDALRSAGVDEVTAELQAQINATYGK